ncbi:MAG: putative membrane protein [Spirosomataceae bacterium]|jgi:uncharacterized membrane protein
MLNKVFKVLGFIFALFIVYGGVQHFLEAEFYSPFVPSVFPFAMPIIYLSGILEVVFGVAYFIPKYRLIGAWGIFILMVVFLPIHLADVFIDAPAIGSKTAAYVRLPVQFLFIVLSWKMVDMAKKSQ